MIWSFWGSSNESKTKIKMFWLFFPLVRLAKPYQVSLEENLNHITRENAIKSTEGIGIPIKFQFRVRYDLHVFSAVHPRAFMFSSTSELGFFLKTDWKFWPIPERFCQRVAKHHVAQREFRGKMAPVLDSRQQWKQAVHTLLTCEWSQSS